MPEGEPYEKLSSLIEAIAKKHHAPLFEPHITLLGGLTPPIEEIIGKTTALASAVEPFRIELDGIGYLDDYYRCLFAKVKGTEGIIRADKTAREIFGREEDPSFMPHLSLIYGNFRASRKKKLVSSIVEEVTGIQFNVESLHLYSTGGGPSDWRRVEQFSLGK